MIEDSVMDQLEIIIVNDGSQDNTETIAQSYLERFPETFCVISQENRGHGGALNAGCAVAKGKYLKVIDADDWVETKNLPAFLEQLSRCNSDVVLTHFYTIDEGTGEVKKWKTYAEHFGKTYSMDEIMAKWDQYERCFTFHGICYHTKFYQEKGIELSEHVFYEDHEFATIPCCYANSVTPLDLFIYDYRIGDAQQSVSDENQLRRIDHVSHILRRFSEEYQRLMLSPDASGRAYYCMKVQGLLMSFLSTIMLVEKDKKRGRQAAKNMMQLFQEKMPKVYESSIKQYMLFSVMNLLHISKGTLQKMINSSIYRMLRNKRSFN